MREGVEEVAAAEVGMDLGGTEVSPLPAQMDELMPLFGLSGFLSV